ncbi:MFS transporter [Pseudonocardia halophobica]|uniref:MFS transporter n=1 Tax=Pseudonocardia halophobica TaxID=29401 RepID=A0A9W6P0B9_9PSEU|nr:MFS transporter [Pseudonocardia halophobica]GLL15478.1 MFS transporter [Pseudonocardia halophobica]
MRTAAFRLMLVVTVLGFGGHALLLPVLPLWVSRAGTGEFGAGTTTGVLMATTVATQLAVPALLRRVGYRVVLGAGLVLLGAPAPFLLLTAELGPVLLISAVRGIGFGLLTVAGSALVAELVPPAEHGRATARYGYAIGIPQLFLLPLGVATVDLLGFAGVFLAAGIAPLLGAAAVPFLRTGRPVRAEPRVQDPAELGTEMVRSWRAGTGPMAAMLACSLAQGGLVTFLPLVAPAASAAAPLALFAVAVGGILGRGLAGGLVDRRGAGRLLLPGTLLAAVGMGVEVLSVGGSGWLLVVGAFAVGGGFGLVQSDSLVSLFAVAGPARYGAASAAWNIGFDAGTGVGSSGLGAIAEPFGFRAAFGAAALLLLAVLPLTRRPTP